MTVTNYNQIEDIYQIGNILVYNGININLQDNQTAYEALKIHLSPKELELLSQYIDDQFNNDISVYNANLVEIGKAKLASFDFVVIAKEYGLDIYTKTNKFTSELRYLTSTLEDRHLQKLYNYILYVANHQELSQMP